MPIPPRAAPEAAPPSLPVPATRRALEATLAAVLVLAAAAAVLRPPGLVDVVRELGSVAPAAVASDDPGTQPVFRAAGPGGLRR